MRFSVHKSFDFTRVFEVLQYQNEKYPNHRCLNEWQEGKWKSTSLTDMLDKVDSLSLQFYQKGLVKGDMVILIPQSGSPKWMIIDLALQQIGVIVVPLHPTLHENEIKLIYDQVKPKLIIALTKSMSERWSSLTLSKSTHLEEDRPEYFDLDKVSDTAISLQNTLHELKSNVHEDDVCTLLYTSGSTGVTKGVLLSHKNIVHNIKAILTVFPLLPTHKVLSFLPFSHIFERTTCYTYLAFGVAIYFNNEKERLSHDFRSVRPDFCTAVPRVLEQMYDQIDVIKLRKNIVLNKIIDWSIHIGEKYDVNKTYTLTYTFQLWLARKLVLNNWKKALGGKLTWMAVGASALRPEISRLFTAGGVRIIEGYGMTEMAPLISLNRLEPGMYKIGSVGMTIQGVELRIESPEGDGTGEILVKGPNLMKGYFKQSELTESVMTPDGWFKTGDIGFIREKRFLFITDRKKDIFKTSAGKYISPLPLQLYFEQSPFILRTLILGFQKPFVSALIVPNFELVKSWCIQNSVHYTSDEYMVHNIKVKGLFQSEIDRLNEKLATHERVRKFVLCHQDWSVENKELTTSLKPIRHLLMEHYQKAIDDMYVY